ncbi:MAG: hypothetical protein ABII18_00860 [bacterium]|nr:hypothetical protein [bacterium]MBU1916689.1 hypothetical protein [bacterium]
MTNLKQFALDNINNELRSGEEVLFTGFMYKEVAKWMRIFNVLRAYKLKHYFAVGTNQRLILIRTKITSMKGDPKELNLGVSSIEYCHVVDFKKGKWLNSRQSYFTMRDGTVRRLDLLGRAYAVFGHEEMYETYPGWVEKQFQEGVFAKLPHFTQMKTAKPKKKFNPAPKGLFALTIALFLIASVMIIPTYSYFEASSRASNIAESQTQAMERYPEMREVYEDDVEEWESKSTSDGLFGILFLLITVGLLGGAGKFGHTWYKKHQEIESMTKEEKSYRKVS